jgi:hypothetical protein
MEPNLLISLLAILVSILSYMFAKRSWYETYRPIVTARIETHHSGNSSALFKIVLYNVGNRPATDIRLKTKQEILDNAFEEGVSESMETEIRACFSDEGTIPLLHPGNMASNGFGMVGREENRSIYGSKIPVTIEYKDLNRKKIKTKQTLILKHTTFFAGSGWGSDE